MPLGSGIIAPPGRHSEKHVGFAYLSESVQVV